MPGNMVVSLAASLRSRAIGIDARLNERLLCDERLERPVQWRPEMLVEFVLRPRGQTLRGERAVDAAREWHARVDENAVEVEQHSVVISHRGRS